MNPNWQYVWMGLALSAGYLCAMAVASYLRKRHYP